MEPEYWIWKGRTVGEESMDVVDFFDVVSSTKVKEQTMYTIGRFLRGHVVAAPHFRLFSHDEAGIFLAANWEHMGQYDYGEDNEEEDTSPEVVIEVAFKAIAAFEKRAFEIVDTWSLVAKRLNMIRDMRVKIAKIVFQDLCDRLSTAIPVK